MITVSLSLPFSFFPPCQLLRLMHLYFHVFPTVSENRETASSNGEVAPRPSHFLVFICIYCWTDQFMLGISRKILAIYIPSTPTMTPRLLFNHLNQPLTILTTLLHSHMPDSPKNPHTCKIQ